MMIVSMSILVALSDLFGEESAKDTVIVGEHMPIYKALLYSMIFPLVATAMTFMVKYASKTVRISSYDFAWAFQFFYSWVFLALGVYKWISHDVDFTLKHFIQGAIVGCCTSLAAAVATKALSLEGVPAGPVVAVMNS